MDNAAVYAGAVTGHAERALGFLAEVVRGPPAAANGTLTTRSTNNDPKQSAVWISCFERYLKVEVSVPAVCQRMLEALDVITKSKFVSGNKAKELWDTYK